MFAVAVLSALLCCSSAMAAGGNNSTTGITFVEQPSVTGFDDENLIFYVEWETNVLPDSIVIGNRNDHGWSEAGSLSSEEIQQGRYGFSTYYIGRTVFLRAWSEQLSSFVDSEEFTINADIMYFTTQPFVTLDCDELEYQVSWETNFKPTSVEVSHKIGDYREVVQYIYKNEDLGKSMSCVIPIHYAGSQFLITAVYEQNFGSNILSIPFTLSTDDLCFINQPEKGLWDESFTQCTVAWSTSFVPVKIQVFCHSDSGDSIVKQLTDNLTKEASYPFTHDDFGKTFFFRAFYADYNNCYVDSNPITIDHPRIFFDANGGSGTMKPVNANIGQEFTLPENSFIPTAGKVFSGWTVNSGTILVHPGDTITITKDVTLTAQWIGPYTVTFLKGRGSGTMPPVSITPGTRIILPECEFQAPTGATFSGWKNGNYIYQPGNSLIVNTNLSFTAYWKGPFYIHFDTNGGSGQIPHPQVGYGQNYTFPTCSITPPAGKTFDYWYIQYNGAQNRVWPRYTMAVYEDVHATPIWRDARVTFEANGGEGILYPTNLVPESDGSIILPECSLIPPEGKMFSRWSIGESGQPGNRVAIYGDTTVTPVWSDAILTLTFALNGASGDIFQHTLWGTQYYTLPSAEEWMTNNRVTPPEGTIFSHWEIPQAIGRNSSWYYPGETVQLITNGTAAAQWVQAPPSTCTISFDPGDGSGSMASITVPYGEPFEMPDCEFTPPQGERFSYWIGISTDGLHAGDEATVYSDYTVTARYGQPRQYNIIFYDEQSVYSGGDQTAIEGQCIPDPGSLVKPGYTFNGWKLSYTVWEGSDYHFEEIPVDFSVPVDYYAEVANESSLHLYADWTVHWHHIALNVTDGGYASIRDLENHPDGWRAGTGIWVDWEAYDGRYLESITLMPDTGGTVDVTYPDFQQPHFLMPDCNVRVNVRFTAPTIRSGMCGNLSWTLDGSGTLTISGVGAMPDYAWENEAPWMEWRNDIRSVEIQPGVTSAGNLAFEELGNLISVSLPATMTRIGSMAFYCCNSLGGITLPDGLTILGDSAFQETAITTVDIPAGVRVIDESAFSGCVNLTSVTLHEGLEEIGDSAFSYCESLTEISIPQSVTALGTYTFDSCTALQRVSGLEQLGQLPIGLFCECASLTDIGLMPRMAVIEGDTFARCHSLSSIAIPSTVTRIEDWAFDECDSLTAVYYEGSRAMWDAIQIGNYNDGLQNATIYCKFVLTFETFGGPEIEPILFNWNEIPPEPENPDRIGAYFRGWYLEDTLDTLYEFDTPLNADTTLYADYLGADPSMTLRLPNALTTIESEAFAGAQVLFVAVPKTVTSIADDAFPQDTEYIMGYRGSAAENWARTHGIAFIEIDDGWMASH